LSDVGGINKIHLESLPKTQNGNVNMWHISRVVRRLKICVLVEGCSYAVVIMKAAQLVSFFVQAVYIFTRCGTSRKESGLLKD